MRPYYQTVVGCYEDPEEGDFVEHVQADSPEAAVREAIRLDPCRLEARIVAVFYQRQYDTSLTSELGSPRYGRDYQ